MSVNEPVFPGELWDGQSPRRNTRLKDASPDYEDYDQIVAEVISMQRYLLNTAPSGVFEAEADSEVEVGTPVYLGVDGHVNPGEATAQASSRIAGISVTDTLAGFSASYVTDGQVTRSDWTVITGEASLTPGADYFLSTVFGKMTKTAPTSVGEFVVRLGKAQSPTVFDVEISPCIRL